MKITIEPETDEERQERAEPVVYEHVALFGFAGLPTMKRIPLPAQPIYHSHGPFEEVYIRLAGLMFHLARSDQSCDGR